MVFDVNRFVGEPLVSPMSTVRVAVIGVIVQLRTFIAIAQITTCLVEQEQRGEIPVCNIGGWGLLMSVLGGLWIVVSRN